jgi:hypothetical protein
MDQNGITNSTVSLPLTTRLLEELLETLFIKRLNNLSGGLTSQLETEVIKAHLPTFRTTTKLISNPCSGNSITLMAVSPSGELLTPFKDSLWIGSTKSD